MADNRKLAPNEQSMEILNRCAGSYNVVTISRIKGNLSEEIALQALDLIQSRHPRLNSRIVGDLDNLHFESGADKIPLRVASRNNSEQWLEVVLEELNKPIESDKGLVRTVLISLCDENISYLLTIIHHAISDGLSTIQLHSEILTYCGKIAAGKIEDDISSLLPLPNIQELMPKSMRGKGGAIRGIFSLLRLKLKLLWHRPKTMSFQKSVPINLRRCGMISRKLNQEITTQLIELCRKEKTTVQGALCAALLLAVSKIIRDDNQENLRLSCRSYINLRKYLKPEVNREHLGVLASSITSFHNLNINTSFWDLARDVRQQLEVGLKSEDIFGMVLMSRKIFESLLSRPNEAPVTVGVTNVGQIDVPHDYGLFQLEEISFVPAQAVFGGVFSAAVTTFQGTMLLNFMFSEPSISIQRVEILANDVINYLVNACNQ
jgi:NRPS condensation-like uncharacterized protein